MLKKLMVTILALVLGGFAAEAANLMQLELRVTGGGSVKLVDKLPTGVFTAEPILRKTEKVYRYYVILDKTQSVELKFRVKGDAKLGPALSAFKREKGQKNQPISVKCKVFELDGEPAGGIPGVISKWKRIMVRDFQDGDVVTLKMEFEKPEE